MTDADRMAAAGLTPIMLGDAGCPGRYLPIRNASAGICYGCSRLGVQTAHMLEPQAELQPGGEWFCPERRSAGVPAEAVPDPGGESCGSHGGSVPRECGGTAPLHVGGTLLRVNDGEGVKA